MPEIGLVTCTDLPEPDPDEEIQIEAIREAGAEASLVAWDDPDQDLARYDLLVFEVLLGLSVEGAVIQAVARSGGRGCGHHQPTRDGPMEFAQGLFDRIAECRSSSGSNRFALSRIRA